MTRPHYAAQQTITPMVADRGTDWREQAACVEYRVSRGDDPWFSDSADERARALAICHTCPVIDQCASAAVGEPIGVWAGVAHGYRGRPRTTPPEQVSTGRPVRGRPITQTLEIVEEMWDTHSPAQIIAHLGVTASAVGRALSRAGRSDLARPFFREKNRVGGAS